MRWEQGHITYLNSYEALGRVSSIFTYIIILISFKKPKSDPRLTKIKGEKKQS